MCFKWENCIFWIFLNISDSEGFQPVGLLKDVSPGSDAFFPAEGASLLPVRPPLQLGSINSDWRDIQLFSTRSELRLTSRMHTTKKQRRSVSAPSDPSDPSHPADGQWDRILLTATTKKCFGFRAAVLLNFTDLFSHNWPAKARGVAVFTGQTSPSHGPAQQARQSRLQREELQLCHIQHRKRWRIVSESFQTLISAGLQRLG